MQITFYTDGGCRGNPGIGGWGVVLIVEGKNIGTYSGYSEEETTNNKMELTAGIEALKLLYSDAKLKRIFLSTESTPSDAEIRIISDSAYLANGMTQWRFAWEKNNWKTKDRKRVKNRDLWEQLVEFNKKLNIQWEWVKGHGVSDLNKLADRLANEAMDSYKIRRDRLKESRKDNVSIQNTLF